jgi:hypothetical protein
MFVRQALPDLRHLKQRGPGFRVLDGARSLQALSREASVARSGIESVDFGHCSLRLQAGAQRGLSATSAWRGPLPMMTDCARNPNE